MELLKQELDALIKKLPNEDDFLLALESLVSVYPFNEYEYVISSLLGSGVLTLNAYYDLRDSYIARNPYLHVFELTPIAFGGEWVENHLKILYPALTLSASKEYDFSLDGQIRIEVKASRAVDKKSKALLFAKALTFDSKHNFEMNFQQIKPRCCDVFVWVAVWSDVIRYWVLSSHEVENNVKYSNKHHRGNIGEGQLHIRKSNIALFNQYLVLPDKLTGEIRKAYEREQKIRGKS